MRSIAVRWKREGAGRRATSTTDDVEKVLVMILSNRRVTVDEVENKTLKKLSITGSIV